MDNKEYQLCKEHVLDSFSANGYQNIIPIMRGLKLNELHFSTEGITKKCLIRHSAVEPPWWEPPNSNQINNYDYVIFVYFKNSDEISVYLVPIHNFSEERIVVHLSDISTHKINNIVSET